MRCRVRVSITTYYLLVQSTWNVLRRKCRSDEDGISHHCTLRILGPFGSKTCNDWSIRPAWSQASDPLFKNCCSSWPSSLLTNCQSWIRFHLLQSCEFDLELSLQSGGSLLWNVVAVWVDCNHEKGNDWTTKNRVSQRNEMCKLNKTNNNGYMSQEEAVLTRLHQPTISSV